MECFADEELTYLLVEAAKRLSAAKGSSDDAGAAQSVVTQVYEDFHKFRETQLTLQLLCVASNIPDTDGLSVDKCTGLIKEIIDSRISK